MYLLSLRLAPSPWVGTRFSATAQYTVPSVSTHKVTPRRVGFFACTSAPPRAEPAGPSVWCTMMLRHGFALPTSPHGASHTIFRPGMSGVPEARASLASSASVAAAGAIRMRAARTAASRREIIMRVQCGPDVSTPLREFAQGLTWSDRVRHERRRRIVHGKVVLAASWPHRGRGRHARSAGPETG